MKSITIGLRVRSPIDAKEKAYSSGFVLIKDMTRSPSFHCPRFLSNSTRSNRLRTLRFLLKLAGGLKLGCLLISLSILSESRY